MVRMKKCNKCLKVKSIECFNKNKTKKDGREGYCRECRKAYYKVEYTTLTGRARMLKINCAKRSREFGYECDLTNEWIKEKIKEGCVLTGVSFNLEDVKHPFAPSIDRIDSNKGYTKDNCRLVVMIANYAKNMWDDDALYDFAEKLLNHRVE